MLRFICTRPGNDSLDLGFLVLITIPLFNARFGSRSPLCIDDWSVGLYPFALPGFVTSQGPIGKVAK